jgi:hypothetical protein
MFRAKRSQIIQDVRGRLFAPLRKRCASLAPQGEIPAPNEAGSGRRLSPICDANEIAVPYDGVEISLSTEALPPFSGAISRMSKV